MGHQGQDRARAPLAAPSFDDIAGRYERWYSTAAGARVASIEASMLQQQLARLGPVPSGLETGLEVGCGTGHFTRRLAGWGLDMVGLDTSLAMLSQAQQRQDAPAVAYVLGDGQALPFPDRTFDVVALITALEFMSDPPLALHEAARVARRGMLLGALNRHSLLQWQRRRAGRLRPSIYDRGRYFSVSELVGMVRAAAGQRLRGVSWRTGLLLGNWPPFGTCLPWGGFIALSATLTE